MVMQRYQLTLAPGQDIVPTPLISQVPRDGLYMQVEAHQPALVEA